MKIALTKEIKQSDGIKPILNKKNGNVLILKDVCINALLTPLEKEDEKKKYPDYEIYKKILNVQEVDLKSEEIARIKRKIELIDITLIMGQAWDLLEGVKT